MGTQRGQFPRMSRVPQVAQVLMGRVEVASRRARAQALTAVSD